MGLERIIRLKCDCCGDSVVVDTMTILCGSHFNGTALDYHQAELPNGWQEITVKKGKGIIGEDSHLNLYCDKCPAVTLM